MTSPHGTAAWILYGFQIAGVIGTFGAVSVALTLGVRAARRESSQRDRAAVAQARLVFPRFDLQSAGWWLKVYNSSERAVKNVQVAVQLREGTGHVPAWYPLGEVEKDFIAVGNFARFAFEPEGTGWVHPDNRGNQRYPEIKEAWYSVSVGWVDADGVQWSRRDLDEPKRLTHL